MKHVVGTSVLVAIIAAVVGGTCVGFMALMAPAEIKPIVAKASAAEPAPELPPTPPEPPEQVAPKPPHETAGFRHPDKRVTKMNEPEPKKAKRSVAKKAMHVARRRVPERRQYGHNEQPPQMFGSFGGFIGTYWR